MIDLPMASIVAFLDVLGFSNYTEEDFSGALRVAEAALSRIRSRLQPYKTDYALLSQEGFVMMLLKAIGTSVRPFQTTGEKFRARWDKLG
jgi:hypothetical protein